MKKKIFLVENEPSVRDSLKHLLELKKYSVYVASNPTQAKELLQKKWVHLAIIDLRLIEDSDSKDFSGLFLAREIDPEIVKIILTGYPSIESIRMALGHDAAGVIAAVDFINKQEGPFKLLERIKWIFKNEIKINFDLGIQFADNRTFENLIDGSMSKDEREEQIEESTEIFQRLFLDANNIVIFPLVQGFGGAGVVKVVPEYESGIGNEVVVKFGMRKLIEKEKENFNKYVRNFVGGFRRTDMEGFAYTLKLAGIAYALIGTSLQEAYSFGKYYREKNIVEIEKAVTGLFTETCNSWYDGRMAPEMKDLAAECRSKLSLKRNAIEDAFRGYLPNFIKSNLKFDVSKCWDDIISWIEVKNFFCPVSFCITHGDLNENNFFVDEHGNTWLIDFFKTGKSYWLRDFIMLEATIKFSLLKVTNLGALYELEEALLAQEQFFESNDLHQFTGDDADELNKAFRVIKKIRSLAYLKSGGNVDINEYYVGLLFQTIEFVCKRITEINKEYALLSAIRTCEKLE